MADPYVNQFYIVTVEFFDTTGALADPTTPVFTKQAPDGTQTSIASGSLTHASTGVYTYTTSESVPGTYTWEGKDTGGTMRPRDLVRVKVNPGIT